MKSSAGPPKHLSPAAKKWWRQVQNEFEIDDIGSQSILTAAAEAFDRMRQAAAIVDREGLTTIDRWKQTKMHPAAILERDARTQMLQAIKQLGLDLEPLQPGRGRPVGR